MAGRERRGRGARGFSYLGVMLWLAVLGIGLAAIGQLWQTVSQRQKEAELLFVGDQFRRAIESFHQRNPNAGDGFPKSFDELLLDPHQPGVQRHLRRLYPDPLTGKPVWGIVKSPAGGIAGVFSLAAGIPLKQSKFAARYQEFAGAPSYANWHFGIAPPPENMVASNVPPRGPVAGGGSPPADPAAGDPEPTSKCEQVAMNDQSLCRQEQNKWHDSATACYAAAQTRAAACAAGVSLGELPPLPLRYGSPTATR